MRFLNQQRVIVSPPGKHKYFGYFNGYLKDGMCKVFVNVEKHANGKIEYLKDPFDYLTKKKNLSEMIILE